MSNQFDDALNNLDLHGVMMVQGMLVNRALKILHEQKQEPKKNTGLILPDKDII